jgi:hypothetical protein
MLKYIQSLADRKALATKNDPQPSSEAGLDQALARVNMVEIVWPITPSQDLSKGLDVSVLIYSDTRHDSGQLITLGHMDLTIQRSDDLRKEFSELLPFVDKVIVSFPFEPLEKDESRWSDPRLFDNKLKDAVQCIWSLRDSCDFTLRCNPLPADQNGLVFHTDKGSGILVDDAYIAVQSVLLASDEGWEEGEWGRIPQGSVHVDDDNEWGLMPGLEASQCHAVRFMRLSILIIPFSLQVISWRYGESP